MEQACPAGGERCLTAGERELVAGVFGTAIDPDPVRIRRRKWFPFQPANIVMAPCGHMHFHPHGPHYRDDFALAPLTSQGLFIHEMVHVWQAQAKGRFWLVLHRHPFCRYDYELEPGKPLAAYGIEQQAEIVRHAFLLRSGAPLPGKPPRAAYDAIVAFPGAGAGA
ncbi:vgr related protein [Novosphingobium sp. TH158]|uniref:vgr related protein n=1 Tax=Novosphingobium sp. TH158 TaxID=2067455 RepID=UPI000C7A1D3A|nr:vgr related protein [Novosphingobium sp. TH158]PLK25896.1 vgr related protein [Novosphingobium sp. TH158]